jgi:putative FmdB family regulatory protein
MPFYEYLCNKCGTRAEVFARSISTEVKPPACPAAGRQKGHEMTRIMSKAIRRLTLADQLAEAEAKYGKEVESVLGPEPDIGKHSRRYDRLAKDLPRKEDL